MLSEPRLHLQQLFPIEVHLFKKVYNINLIIIKLKRNKSENIKKGTKLKAINNINAQYTL
jgi:hypothetical protein